MSDKKIVLRTSISLTQQEHDIIKAVSKNEYMSIAGYIKKAALTITPEQLKSITNTSSPAKEIAEMVKGKTDGI